MSKDPETKFSDLVRSRLSHNHGEARTLWVPLAQELDRAGPDAVNEYLAAQRQALEGRVEALMSQVEDRIDG